LGFTAPADRCRKVRGHRDGKHDGRPRDPAALPLRVTNTLELSPGDQGWQRDKCGRPGVISAGGGRHAQGGPLSPMLSCATECSGAGEPDNCSGPRPSALGIAINRIHGPTLIPIGRGLLQGLRRNKRVTLARTRLRPNGRRRSLCENSSSSFSCRKYLSSLDTIGRDLRIPSKYTDERDKYSMKNFGRRVFAQADRLAIHGLWRRSRQIHGCLRQGLRRGMPRLS
jgi:hypothetical protein